MRMISLFFDFRKENTEIELNTVTILTDISLKFLIFKSFEFVNSLFNIKTLEHL